MFRNIRRAQNGTEQKKLRYFFSSGNVAGFIRYAAYAALIITMTFNFCGCALIGLLLRLAPLAAVVVEYSPPVQTEDGKIVCVKAFRYVEQNGESSRVVKSEYFLVVLGAQGTEDAGCPLEIGEEYFVTEKFSIEKRDKGVFALYFASEKITRKWEFEVGQKSLLIITSPKPLFTNPAV